MHSKVEVVACRTLKIVIMFIVAVLVHVTKYIYGQHLYKEADACTAKCKLWHAGLQKQILLRRFLPHRRIVFWLIERDMETHTRESNSPKNDSITNCATSQPHI